MQCNALKGKTTVFFVVLFAVRKLTTIEPGWHSGVQRLHSETGLVDGNKKVGSFGARKFRLRQGEALIVRIGIIANGRIVSTLCKV